MQIGDRVKVVLIMKIQGMEKYFKEPVVTITGVDENTNSLVRVPMSSCEVLEVANA